MSSDNYRQITGLNSSSAFQVLKYPWTSDLFELNPYLDQNATLGLQALPGLYRSVLQWSLQFLSLTGMWQECFLAFSCPARPLFPHRNQGTKGRRRGCQGLPCQELETAVVNPWSWAPASERAPLPAPRSSWHQQQDHIAAVHFVKSIMLHLIICTLNPADNCFHSSLSPRKGASLEMKRMRDGEATISHSFFILKHFEIEISRFGNVVSLEVFVSISCLKGCEEWFFFDREILKPELNQLN